jgi:hypothetical protein
LNRVKSQKKKLIENRKKYKTSGKKVIKNTLDAKYFIKTTDKNQYKTELK